MDILIASGYGDRKTRIEVGYGLENIITDSIALNIVEKQLLSNFKLNLFNEGITEAVQKSKR